MEAVNCAVIGLGVIGREHAAILAASPAADLLLCCDLDANAEGRVPPGIAFSVDPDEALNRSGLEAVFICTPEFAHREIVEAALRRGVHVFCEKPLATTLDDADAMIAAAAESSGRLVVGHLLRFDPRYAIVHDRVAGGQLGEPVHIFARRTTWAAEGQMVRGRTSLPLYQGVHDLDVLRWIAGDINRVYAEAGGAGVIGDDIPDSVVSTVRFATGAVGLFELSWATPVESGIEWDSRLAVHGTKGSAFVDIRETGVSIFAGNGVAFPDTGYWTASQGLPFGILRAEDEYFLHGCRASAPWPVELADARAAVTVALAMDRSIEEGRPIMVSDMG
jgi:predicted dehydrogenase